MRYFSGYRPERSNRVTNEGIHTILILTRKPGDAIVIDDSDIVITIISVKGRKVRVGIEARNEVRVMRRELLEPCQSASNAKS